MRRSWRNFRRRFDALCLRPILDYAACQSTPPEGGLYRFTGGFESLTDGQTLWIRSDILTIPIALKGAHIYMLPLPEGGSESPLSFDLGEESPTRIRWDRISTLTEGAKVFVGGLLVPLRTGGPLSPQRKPPCWLFFMMGRIPLLPLGQSGRGGTGTSIGTLLPPTALSSTLFPRYPLPHSFFPGLRSG